MNATGYERVRRETCRVLCATLLLMTGCTALPRERTTPLPTRDLLWEKEGMGTPADRPFLAFERDPEQTPGWQMSSRLRPTRSPDRANEPPAPPLPNPAITPHHDVDRRITVQVIHTPAREFFEGLASQDPGVNMIVHPEVDEDISVELKNVSVDEAVEIVCEMYQLDCQPFSSQSSPGVRGYKIFPWQLTTRTYPVDFLSVVRDGYSQTLVSSGNRQEITTTRTNKDQTKSTTATPSTPGSGMRTEYKSDFWTDLENTITSILQLGLTISKETEETNEQGQKSKSVIRERRGHGSNKPRPLETRIKLKKKEIQIESDQKITAAERQAEAKAAQVAEDPNPSTELSAPEKGVVVNRQAGLITVRAYPREHQEIATFLEQLRTRSQRQVILEAKILEVTLNDGSQFGVDWLAVNRGIGRDGLPPLLSEPGSGNTFLSRPVLDPSASNNGAALVTKGLIFSRAVGVDQPFNLALRTGDFIGFLHLLQQQGKVQVLSSPRVATVNNQKAVIKVGSDEFFITGLQPGTVTWSGTAQVVNPPTAQIESMFTGISLDVTPQVGEGDMITLHIHPLVTDVQDKMKSFIIDDKPQSLPLAFSQTRETDTIIRVHNGEVAVIGGLMKNSSTTQEDRLPWLGEIPLLGALFGHEAKKAEKSELVILLRPVVVDNRQDWSDHVGRAAERIYGIAQTPP